MAEKPKTIRASLKTDGPIINNPDPSGTAPAPAGTLPPVGAGAAPAPATPALVQQGLTAAEAKVWLGERIEKAPENMKAAWKAINAQVDSIYAKGKSLVVNEAGELDTTNLQDTVSGLADDAKKSVITAATAIGEAGKKAYGAAEEAGIMDFFKNNAFALGAGVLGLVLGASGGGMMMGLIMALVAFFAGGFMDGDKGMVNNLFSKTPTPTPDAGETKKPETTAPAPKKEVEAAEVDTVAARTAALGKFEAARKADPNHTSDIEILKKEDKVVYLRHTGLDNDGKAVTRTYRGEIKNDNLFVITHSYDKENGKPRDISGGFQFQTDGIGKGGNLDVEKLKTDPNFLKLSKDMNDIEKSGRVKFVHTEPAMQFTPKGNADLIRSTSGPIINA